MAPVHTFTLSALVFAGSTHFVSSTSLLSFFVDDAIQVEEEVDEFVAFQEHTNVLKETTFNHQEAHAAGTPQLVQLRRETVPVYRRGKIASFKTSYSGVLHVGAPSQEFRVVFDTGSGHVILPAAECKSEACLVHRTYNMTASETAQSINADGTLSQPGEPSDEVTIGFGTGQVTGEFSRDKVCLGMEVEENQSANEEQENKASCVDMHIVVAMEMSSQPFKSFKFDGIFGLGLSALALSEEFSAFEMMSRTVGNAHFGAYLTEGEEEGEDDSEIALGGHNPARLLEPLSWVDVVMPELGYWQVEIVAIRIGGQELDVCRDGTCRGVVDTGTSHLGVPAPHDKEVDRLLTVPAGDLLDCRLAPSPEIQIELRNVNLTLHSHSYMRRLPLREGVTVGMKSISDDKSIGSSSAAAVPGPSNAAAEVPSSPPALGSVAQVAPQAGQDQEQEKVERFCRPKTLGVNLPAPVGPKLFILGEPVLHRYYTVFDWKTPAVAFGLANTKGNVYGAHKGPSGNGALPKTVGSLLLQKQKQKTLYVPQRLSNGEMDDMFMEEEDEEVDEAVLLQVRVFTIVRRVRATPL